MMNARRLLLSIKRAQKLVAVVGALGLAHTGAAHAVMLTGTQVNANEWSYDLTFNPLDNYSVYQANTTITVTGLYGVSGATGPSSTDFLPDSPYLDGINLTWTAEVLDGGTTVRWTHEGPGTGNFDVDKHVYGFKIFADGASDGLAIFTTDGVSRDTNNPLPGNVFELDVTGHVNGPVAPIPVPGALWLMGSGLIGLGAVARRRKIAA